jgi:ATP-binding cassette subfamily C protein LapB
MLDKNRKAARPSETDNQLPPDDTLLACLEYVARQLGKPFTQASVLSGLPLKDGRLTVALFSRAAERAGLSAKLVERSAIHVPGLVIPFIVLFENGDAGVIVSKDPGQNTARIVLPSVSTEPLTVSLTDLNTQSSGYVIYITSSPSAKGSDPMRSGRVGGRSYGHWFWGRVRQFWPSWAQIVFVALVINILGLALPLFIMNVYDRVIPNLAIPTLWALASGVILALVFDFSLKQLRAIVLDRTGRRVDMTVAATLFEHALGIAMSDRTGSSGALANEIREFEQVRDFFTSSSIIAATDLLFIGVFVFVLWAIVGPIAWVPLLAVPLVLIATLFVQVPLAKAVEDTQREASRRHSILVESLISVETIKAMCAEGVMQRRWEDAVAATARTNSATKFWSSLALYFTSLVQQAVSVVIIVWGVFLVAEGEISIGGLIAANILAGRILAPLGNIALTLARAQQAFAALSGISAFMELKSERPREISEGCTVRSGDVEFKTACFTYPGESAEALSNASFEIRSGERVGIVGRIGSGKTTIGKLLAGLYTVDKGSVSVGGINVNRFEPADLRQGVTYLSQDPELFAGNLRDNIILGKPNASEEDIAEVTRISGVDAFTARHPLGLSMPIGEKGRGLSGGQQQAVAIARALLRKPKIFFLDEPASAMDTGTEAQLVNRLNQGLTEEQTLIVSTHRVSVLELVDRLIVLDDGKILADGPKDEVVKALRSNPIGNAASN